MSAPVGLDLGAVSAEETALSILAEVVASRHGREGGRLTGAGGRIHAGRRLTVDRRADPRRGRRHPVRRSEPKQLADLGGRPLLEWAVRAQCSVPDARTRGGRARRSRRARCSSGST